MINAPSIADERDGIQLHEPFLERASEADIGFQPHALGGFLTMRIIDLFAPGRPRSDGALAYQISAAAEYIESLSPTNPDTSHLREILRVAESVRTSENQRLLWPPMLAFAYSLEQGLRLAEALDVLDTLLRLREEQETQETVAANLQRGRALRRASCLDEAMAAYTIGGDAALKIGDRHSELLSRIGRAIVMQKLGNLPGSERMLRAVLAEAEALGDRDAAARALHDLAVAVRHQGRSTEAVSYAYKAYVLYERPANRYRALSDLGEALESLGYHAAAEDAFQIILAGEDTPTIRVNAMLELLDIASSTGNRMSFERWRRELDAMQPGLPPDAVVDLDLRTGVGLASFGMLRRGRSYLRKAIRRAEKYNLNEYLFRAERALEEVELPKEPVGEPVGWAADPDVNGVADQLQLLRATI